MHNANEVRDRILNTASDLFYNHGIRAVGVDLVVEKAGVAKTSLYRHFATKDDLVVAFLQEKDREFFDKWDALTSMNIDNPEGELFALLEYIGENAAEPSFRGCPQLNIAAEFPDIAHPARQLAKGHKLEMRKRLEAITRRLGCKNAGEVAGQLAILINGAITSTTLYASKEEAKNLLLGAAKTLLALNSHKI